VVLKDCRSSSPSPVHILIVAALPGQGTIGGEGFGAGPVSREPESEILERAVRAIADRAADAYRVVEEALAVDPRDESGLVAAAKHLRMELLTPYGVSFASDTGSITLVTLHVTYGTSPQDRIPELTEIAQWLARWAKKKDVLAPNLIALGDFNIDRRGDPLHQAFTSTGLTPPDALNYVPRTVFDDPDPQANPNHAHFYDQIAWFTGSQGAPMLSLGFRNAGMFDFTGGLISATDTRNLSWRISDHFPLWVEFGPQS
jgi:hypothetical protein